MDRNESILPQLPVKGMYNPVKIYRVDWEGLQLQLFREMNKIAPSESERLEKR